MSLGYTTPALWLQDFLERRSLSSVTGASLFTYQSTEDEYIELRELVTRFKPKTSLSRLKHKEWSACFVLCCSEWYRRDCDRPQWTWEPIWQSFEFELSPSDLAEVLTTGLESYWQRPIRLYTERRNFLGSVFIEGGLPFQLISAKGNHFNNMLRRVLRKYHLIELSGESIGQLIRSQLGYLPSVFQEDDSVELISAIVNQLMRLAEVIDAHNHEESPAQQLDKNDARWREQFPIPLDNETGKNLLNNWLADASSSSERIKKLKSCLQCVQCIDLDSLQVKTQITLPKSLAFNFTKESTSTNRFELNLYDGNNKKVNFGCVYGSFETNSTKIRTRPKHTHITRSNPAQSLWLDVSESGLTLERQEIDDSAIPIGEQPVCFVLRDGRYQFVGQSSVSHKDSVLYVLIPQESKINVLAGSASLIKEVQHNDVALTWYEVEGDIRVKLANSRYRICTNKSSNTQGILRLHGKELEWPSVPSHVYKGVPQVTTITGESAESIGLTVLLDNIPVRQLKGYQGFGRHTLTVQDKDGDVLMKRNIAILPEDLSIHFSSAAEQSEIRVESQSNMLARLTGTGVTVSTQKTSQGRLFQLSPEHLPPAKVNLSIQANLEQDPIEITLPYPANGVFAYDAEGKKLSPEVSINQLLGTELFLYSNEDYTENFRLDFLLTPVNRKSPCYSSTISVGRKPAVISLYAFKERFEELMTLSPELDASVQVRVYCRGREIAVTTVRRYAAELEIEQAQQLVCIKSQGELSFEPELDRSPLAMRIHAPERPPVVLPHKSLGEIRLGYFELAPEMLKEPGWLVVPDKSSPDSFRPRFYAGTAPETLDETPQIKSIQAAVQAFHPKHNPTTIDEFLSQMACNYSHSGWQFLAHLWDNFGYLPLSTFEVWKALARNPKALLMALFKLEFNAELIHKMDTEFPILWECISVAEWKQGLQHYTELLSSIGLGAEYISSYKSSLFDKIKGVFPNMPNELLDELKGSKAIEPLPSELEPIFYRGSYQELIRANSEASWPSFIAPKVIEFAHELPDLDKYLTIEHRHHLPVVLYPAIAAAFASGLLSSQELSRLDNITKWQLKQLRNFDTNWFQTTFCFHLARFNAEL